MSVSATEGLPANVGVANEASTIMTTASDTATLLIEHPPIRLCVWERENRPIVGRRLIYVNEILGIRILDRAAGYLGRNSVRAFRRDRWGGTGFVAASASSKGIHLPAAKPSERLTLSRVFPFGTRMR